MYLFWGKKIGLIREGILFEEIFKGIIVNVVLMIDG